MKEKRTEDPQIEAMRRGEKVYQEGLSVACLDAMPPRYAMLFGFLDALALDVRNLREMHRTAGPPAHNHVEGIPHYEIGNPNPTGYVYPAYGTGSITDPTIYEKVTFNDGWNSAIDAVIALSAKWMYHTGGEEPPFHLPRIGEEERRQLEELKKRE